MKATDVQYLLLDLDGTLLGITRGRVRLEFVWRAIVFLKKRGISPWKTLLALYTMRRAIERPGQQFTNEQRAEQAFARVLHIQEGEARSLLRGMIGDIFPALRAHFFEIPAAREFITWASQHYKLVLATNPFWPQDIVELRLGWAGIPPQTFTFISHAGVMCSAKPTVNYFEELLSKLSLSPQACLMVGDSERKDLPAAQARIPVFLIEPHSPSNQIVLVRARVWSGGFGALRRLLASETGP